MEEFFKKIHTDSFRWYDQIILASIGSIGLALFGQIPGLLVERIVKVFFPQTPFFETFSMYFFYTFGVWIFTVLYLLIARHRRPILKAVGTLPKGNNVRYMLIGLLIGFGMNFFCALIAMLNKDIHLSFADFSIFKFIGLLFAVFVQSSSEELLERAYLLQVLKKGYRSKWVAIIGNSIIFTLLHLQNSGVTALALLNLFLSGILFSLFVWYYDSLWCSFGIHTAWNFTQSILLGLPNSGSVVPYSIFMLDTANATNSFAYNVNFGIEGTILSTLVLTVACVVAYLRGKKRNIEPLDIWVGFERKEVNNF